MLSPQNLSPECQAFLETVALQQGQRREARSPVLFFSFFFVEGAHTPSLSLPFELRTKKWGGTAVITAPFFPFVPSGNEPTCEWAERFSGL